MRGLRTAHRIIACALVVFIAAHLIGHLTILGGADLHQSVLYTLRRIYRAPLIEPLLLGAFALQIALGVRLAWRRGWPKGTPARLQIATGLLFFAFVLNHVGAGLHLRFWTGLETDTYWAAANLATPLHLAFFAPYYFIGVMALFVHLATQPRCSARMSAALIATSTACILAILIGFARVPSTPQIYLDAIPI